MYMVPRINYMIIRPKFLYCKPGGMVWMRGVSRWRIDCDVQECEGEELRVVTYLILSRISSQVPNPKYPGNSFQTFFLADL